MKLSQLSLADYNQLDSIPVINQDLSASGFTPVANTYYRHTGATNDTFTQGVIYLYDTAYHKLGESGGGTLNKYTLSVFPSSTANVNLIHKVVTEAKGRIFIMVVVNQTLCPAFVGSSSADNSIMRIVSNYISTETTPTKDVTIDIYIKKGQSAVTALKVERTVSDNIYTATYNRYTSSIGIYITYWNDTEITA